MEMSFQLLSATDLAPCPRQNKTSSAVQLKHIPTGIVIKVQHTRSRDQNRKIARQMLADKIEQMEKGDESRTAVVGATKAKRKASAKKKSKRKYAKLGDAKDALGGVDEEDAAVLEEDEVLRATDDGGKEAAPP